MYMRLGFAVAINVNPDVLLVDEVLAVGDEGFTHKCLDKFAEFKRSNKTILLVTHSLNLIERFCDEALWLDDGRAMSHGDPKRVVGAYLTKVEEGEEALLAATTARAVESASRASTGRDGQAGRDGQEWQEGPDGQDQPDPRSTTRQTRPRTCFRRPRDAGARARSKSPMSRCSTARGSRHSCSTPAIRSAFA